MEIKSVAGRAHHSASNRARPFRLMFACISYSACSTSEKVDEDHAALAISSSVEAAKAAWMAVTN
jgi:hypothetical protein